MRKIVFLLGLSVAAWSGLPAQADFAAGQAAFTRMDYAAAYKEWQAAAAKGDLDAMHGLGGLFLKGDGVRADPRLAVEWYKGAADKGHVESIFALGQLTRDGTGVRKDPLAAAALFLKAALQKHAGAQFALARLYELGQGVEQDDVKALGWYLVSVESGNPFADERATRLALEVSPKVIADAEIFAKQVYSQGTKL